MLTSCALTEASAPRPESAARLRYLAVFGPAFAVAIGYIDPGNWAADLYASRFGCELLWIVMLSGLLALLLQLASARLALDTGDDLATLMARRWKKARCLLGATALAAIIATDIAEFAGVAAGAALLLHLAAPVCAGVALVGVCVIFAVSGSRLARLQRLLMLMLAGVALFVVWEISHFHLPGFAIAHGLVPRISDGDSLIVAIAIVGATIMPHNLFLHSAMVAEQASSIDPNNRAALWRFQSRETTFALLLATILNSAIILLAAILHFSNYSFAEEFAALRSVSGGLSAALFGGALLVSGLAATVASTLSGDYIVRAFAPFRLPRCWRRAISAAPAAVILACGFDPLKMILWSQALLAALLPAVVIPLVILVAETREDCAVSSRLWTSATTAAVVVCLACDFGLLTTMVGQIV